MAQASATWTNTVAANWNPGQLIKVTIFKEQVLQNVEHIAQTHNHDADTANAGSRLRVKEAKDIWLLTGAAG